MRGDLFPATEDMASLGGTDGRGGYGLDFGPRDWQSVRIRENVAGELHGTRRLSFGQIARAVAKLIVEGGGG